MGDNVGAEAKAPNADAVLCIECGGNAEITSGKVIYPHQRDLYSKKFWKCACGAYCGCHPNTIKPLGYPCGPETRKARSAAHAALDPLWRRKTMSRRDAYQWLADALHVHPSKCHIGMMTEQQAYRVVELVRRRNA